MNEYDRRLTDLLQARYGAAAPEIDGEAGDLLPLLLSHRSVRHYAPEPLPTGLLERMVAAGQSTATSSNLQAWSVVALQEPEHKARAAELCGDQEFIRRAPLFLVFCADLTRLKWAADKNDLPAEGLDYLELFLVGVIDAALAAQNVAVTAEEAGMGICYVGAARNRPRELAALLQLPPRVFALFGMTVGRPAADDTSAVKPRLPQEAVLHREVYSEETRAPAIERYNAAMRAFYDSQGMNVRGDWARHSARRIATVEALTGRHILSEVLREAGFELK